MEDWTDEMDMDWAFEDSFWEDTWEFAGCIDCGWDGFETELAHTQKGLECCPSCFSTNIE